MADNDEIYPLGSQEFAENMTVRERFVMAAMQGILANGSCSSRSEIWRLSGAVDAVKVADTTISYMKLTATQEQTP